MSEVAVEITERPNAAGFHVVDAFLDCDYFLLTCAQCGEGVAQDFVGGRVRTAGELT